MSQLVTIVMYHFIRDMARSRYPEIKGLTIEEFKNQIRYMQNFYNIITMEELIDAIDANEKNPQNSLLLTFDDGYIDHYVNVFPILDELKIQGSFFPPAKAITERKVLDVNKIHFILAAVADKNVLVDRIIKKIVEYQSMFSLEKPDFYYKKYAVANRYDTAEVIFIKRVLQTGLPLELRALITDDLFREMVSSDEAAFASELYMNIDQIRCMLRNGMFIGSHGYDHFWLDTLPPDEQRVEVEKSLEFLQNVGCSTQNWVMCYPYGGHNESLRKIAKNHGCVIGLSTRVAIADLTKDDCLALPRLDTNDLPKCASSQPNQWTAIAQKQQK